MSSIYIEQLLILIKITYHHQVRIQYPVSSIQYYVNIKEYSVNIKSNLTFNRAERSIKPFVIGRKNWLFCCTPKGAKSSSIIYSIIETAKENRLRPFEYLKYIFEVMPNISEENYHTLLPWSKDLPDSLRLKQNDINSAQ